MVDRILFIFTSLAIIIGIVFSYSLSGYTILYYEYSEFHFFIRQLIVGTLSIFLMWFISRFDPNFIIKKVGFVLFFGFLFLMLIMPFLPESLVTSAGGANRWIRLPGFSLAPVEFFKVGFVFFLAWSFSRKFAYRKEKSLKEELLLFLPYAGVFLIIVALIAIIQNDLGQVVLLGLTLSFMVLFAGSSFRLFMSLIGSAFVVAILAIIFSEHRIFRIKLWWATMQNFALSILPEGIANKLKVEDLPEPYQIYYSLNAIKNGGFLGEGVGEGIFKLGFLSEVHTDFVMAGIAEETGLIGIFILIAVMLTIIYRIFKIANRSEDRNFYLFSLGVGLLIAFAFLINAFGISGLIPIKGIAVPFVTYGGSSMLAISIAVGMVLSISKKAKL